MKQGIDIPNLLWRARPNWTCNFSHQKIFKVLQIASSKTLRGIHQVNFGDIQHTKITTMKPDKHNPPSLNNLHWVFYRNYAD